MSKARVFMLTVGHSPRNDLIPDLEPMLSTNIEIIQGGALDAYTVEQVKISFLAVNNEAAMVSRLADGTMVALSAAKMLPLIQKRIDWAEEQGTDAIVLLCTGKFPEFHSSVPLLRPYNLIHSVVPAIAMEMRVAAVFPFAPYAEGMADDWKSDGIEVIWGCIEPKADLKGTEVAALFEGKSPELLVLDCIGYTYSVKKETQEKLGIPVIQPKRLIASILNCMFDN